MAFLYHPDQNPNNELKSRHFLLIQEAYATLLDPESRKNYDTELWLEQKNSFYHSQVISPSLMIKRLQKFAESVKIKKQFFVLENDTTAFLLDALSDKYMAIFHTKATTAEGEIYADYILFLAQDLPKNFRDKVFERLSIVLKEHVNDLDAKIYQIQHARKSSDLYHKYLLLIPILIGIIICIIMYLYAK